MISINKENINMFHSRCCLPSHHLFTFTVLSPLSSLMLICSVSVFTLVFSREFHARLTCSTLQLYQHKKLLFVLEIKLELPQHALILKFSPQWASKTLYIYVFFGDFSNNTGFQRASPSLHIFPQIYQDSVIQRKKKCFYFLNSFY